MKRIAVLLFVLTILLSATAYAGSKTITAAADPWLPFINPDSSSKGLAMEICRAAFSTQGYEVKLEIVPWVRAEEGVKNGEYDILPNTWMTDKRKGYLAYSDPYASNQVKFIKKKGSPFEYNGIPSLAGKVIGIVRGYGYSPEFMNDPNIEREPSTEFMTNIKKVVAGRIDLALEDELVAKATIKKTDSSLLDKIEFTKNALSSNDLYVTCGLANPRHQEIISAFNKGLSEIKANGTYKKIMAKYGI